MHDICVCVCTYHRPELLENLLRALTEQVSGGVISHSVVVVDNDSDRSAEEVVTRTAAANEMPILYYVEPKRNIAAARNMALSAAKGEYIALIDDDEVPDNRWLLNLLSACNEYAADGVLGPVEPRYIDEPPTWVVKGKFFIRPRYKTGTRLAWPDTRCGNVLFRREIIARLDKPFDERYGTGSEDVDFFRRMMNDNRSFIWSDEAVVYESVPAVRCTSRYLMKLALLRGSNSYKYPVGRVRNVAKALVAVPVYSIALPVLYCCGFHYFMSYLIRMLDHLGRLLSFLGFTPVKSRTS